MKRVEVNTRDKWSDKDCLSIAIVEDDGAIKWEKSGHYLMDDTMERIIENGFSDFSVSATRVKREKELADVLARRVKRERSEEELAEMRNAFGKGTQVVDVITGETFWL